MNRILYSRHGLTVRQGTDGTLETTLSRATERRLRGVCSESGTTLEIALGDALAGSPRAIPRRLDRLATRQPRHTTPSRTPGRFRLFTVDLSEEGHEILDACQAMGMAVGDVIGEAVRRHLAESHPEVLARAAGRATA